MGLKTSGQVTILKDDKGTYRLGIANKEIKEDGTEQTIFMRVHVGFKKGVEVKNKTKIDIKEGFMTFFRIKTDRVNDNGEPEYLRFPKIMVLDFDIIEEGIDEVFQSRDYSNQSGNNDFGYPGYGEYDNSSDDLPF